MLIVNWTAVKDNGIKKFECSKINFTLECEEYFLPQNYC